MSKNQPENSAAMKIALMTAAVLLCGALTARAQTGPVPLAQAHAHNDYEHARPLLDALEHGFCSVEADIYLVDGQLLVAHNRSQVAPDRTLQRLYLDPLLARVQRHNGQVFPTGSPFLLLIDLKTAAEPTYAVLRTVLGQYAQILTRFRPDRTLPGAVTVILSGNRPRAAVEKEPERLVGIDGRLEDLRDNPSPHLVPLISDQWRKVFTWTGQGPCPEAERTKLRELVGQTHRQGRKLRFWATPDRPAVWAVLHEAGVDLLNTDDLAGMKSFLLSRRTSSNEAPPQTDQRSSASDRPVAPGGPER